MASPLLDIGGLVIAPDMLKIERARALASLLARDGLAYAKLIECRLRAEGNEEIVVVDVDVQRPQKRAHDVQSTERIGIVFSADDRRPDVQSLRGDFPQVPHLNLSRTEYPKSLCLYDVDWTELKARWTPVRFIERIRFWFAETARGSLHKDDQPLEPLIVGSGYQIVVPHDLLTKVETGTAKIERLVVRFASNDVTNKVLLATRPKEQERGAPFIAVTVRTEPQTHGVIRKSPSTLKELHDFLAAAGCDLLGKLRESAKVWGDDAHLKAKLIVIAACPKRRGETTTVEAADVWTFLTLSTIDEVLIAIGRRGTVGGVSAYLLGEPTDEQQGQLIPLDVVRTTFSYSRDLAAYLNGHDAPTDLKVVAIGLGALGSKLQLSLARSGFGKWTLVDEDVLLPHNLARHQYTGSWVGHRKADIAGSSTFSLFVNEPLPEVIAANVLTPGENEERLSKALTEADVILDFSASVTVARHLAAFKSEARRISVFFNPAGTELVLLAEDKSRTIPLNSLEFQFYRGILTQPELEGHLSTSTGRVRYAASCRDITSRVPDDQISLLAAIGARAVRMALIDELAQIKVWKLDPLTFNVSSLAVPVKNIERQELGGWTVVIDEALKEKLSKLRAEKLPNETGGVLLGFFDHETRCVYIVDTIPSPPDSEEWPTLYIRGSQMLGEEIERVTKITAGNVEYIGEWHSHPEGYSCRPSTDDVKVFSWLTTHMNDEGQPALMGIVGDEGPTFFLGQILWGGK